MAAREDRGRGNPLTDEERQQRHYEETGEWLDIPDLPNRGTGLISASPIGQDEGVTIPTPVFVGIVMFGLGMFIGPALLASTSGGRDYLERAAKLKFSVT